MTFRFFQEDAHIKRPGRLMSLPAAWCEILLLQSQPLTVLLYRNTKNYSYFS